MIGITERGDAARDYSWKRWVADGKPAILITKAPSQLIGEVTPEMNVIVHCTITGYGGTDLEPRVLGPVIEICSYQAMVNKMGADRVVLRIDPIIPYEPWLSHSKWVSEHARGRVRISFLDLYPHVKERLAKAGIILSYETFHAPLPDRIRAWKHLEEPEVCGEPGMKCPGCVSRKDLNILGLNEGDEKPGGYQRNSCNCLGIKKELLKSRTQCWHGCLYCYWKDNGGNACG